MRKIAVILLSVLLLPASVFANANFVIVNGDAPGIGFNDPTPATPVGGNPGTTLGEQRMNVFLHVAGIWGATIDSAVPIRVRGQFSRLNCTATGATLASAGARGIWANTENIREPDTWYHVALANKMAGYDLAPIGNPTGDEEVDLSVSVNSDIGTPGCLQNSAGWYLGLDTNTTVGPTGAVRVNAVATILHEFGHGLGFSNFVSRTTGENAGFPFVPWPDVYEKRMFDNAVNMYWDQMSAAQRLASRVNTGRLVWAGSTVMNEAPLVLSQQGILRVDAPSSIGGKYFMGVAEFGVPYRFPGLSGELVQAIDDANAAGPLTTDGCTAITNNVQGKIAFVNRGTCNFALKTKNAELAGAIGVVVGDNVATPFPFDMGGSGDGAFDRGITIPAGRVTLATADIIRTGLASGTVQVNMGTEPLSFLLGADALNRVKLFAPNPFVSGSSLSHFDVSATRNLLMEPSNTSNLTHNLKAPDDLTFAQMRDIGWYPDADVDLVEDGDDNCVNTANADQANYDGDAQGDACDNDDDNDGVADASDAFPQSNMQATVTIGACSSGARNAVMPDGATLMDLLPGLAANAANHGDFASSVSALTNQARDLGLISGAEKGAIQACAAQN